MSYVINKQTGLRVDAVSGPIGPHHDPYDQMTVTLSLPDGRRASLRTDGLGQCSLALRDADGPIRAIGWHDSQAGARATMLKAQLLAKRLVGARFDDALDAYLAAWEPDPMGGPSRYV